MTDAKKVAVFQMEFDRPRCQAMDMRVGYENGNADRAAWQIARAVLDDVMSKGGTLVIVADNSKVTIIQRPVGADAL